MSYILDALKKSDEKRSSLNISTTTSHYKQPQSTRDHRIQWIITAFFIAAGSNWLQRKHQSPLKSQSNRSRCRKLEFYNQN